MEQQNELAGEVASAPTAEPTLTLWQRARGIVGLLAVVVAFYAVFSSMTGGAGTGASYFLTASEATAQLTALDGKAVRVKGTVILGSYQNQQGSNDHKFDIEEGGAVVHVKFHGPLPDVFKEGLPVVAEGTISADGNLKATEVVAKCPSKYESGKVSDQAKEKMQGTN